MRCNCIGGITVALCLLCGLGSGLGSAVRAQTPALPISGQHVTLAGTLKRVEPGPQSALFAGDDKRQYVLDLSSAKIVLPPGMRLPLTAGMRGTVSGLGNLDGSITVSRLQIAPLLTPAVTATLPVEPADLTVRGTVEAIDLEYGAFVLRINTHTRRVYVTPDTDVSGLGGTAAGPFPVQAGQRVTVGGSLQPDGTVLAGVLTAKEDVDYLTPPALPNRVLFGTISSPANKLGHRDIKIRLMDDTEQRIVVPRGIPVRRTGAQISVYDLSRRDEVRVMGRTSGTDFRAARIDVLASADSADAAPAAAPPKPAPAKPPTARPDL